MTQKNSPGVIEETLRDVGVNSVFGVDEAGMGCLAGPVVVGGVVLPPNADIDGINDSKKLTHKKRVKLSALIYEQAIFASTVFVMPDVIDKINIRNAAMRGIQSLLYNAKTHIDMVVIDGTYKMEGDFRLYVPYMSVPKADALSINVAAASIIAKVARDLWMFSMADKYPHYGWDSNKGYGTAKHIAAIKEHGCCPLHRQSFTVKGVRLNDLSR